MRMMTVPGVGPIAALTFKAAVDDPARFKRSRTVAAHFGLTPRRYQSGEQDNPGRISKAGDRDVRATLYAAANALLMRTMAGSQIKSWGMRPFRVLSVAAASGRVGYVCFEDRRPLDWALSRKASRSPADAVYMLRKWTTLLSPSVVVTETITRQSRKRGKTPLIIDALAREAVRTLQC